MTKRRCPECGSPEVDPHQTLCYDCWSVAQDRDFPPSTPIPWKRLLDWLISLALLAALGKALFG